MAKLNPKTKAKLENPNHNIICYVLVRQDLESLNPGKGYAHSHHAGTQMCLQILKGNNAKHKKLLDAWNVGDGAGVCITKASSHERFMVAVEEAKRLGLPAGVWTDQEFPSTTERGFFLIRMDVCAWMLGTREQLAPIVGDLPLCP